MGIDYSALVARLDAQAKAHAERLRAATEAAIAELAAEQERHVAVLRGVSVEGVAPVGKPSSLAPG